MYPKKWLTPSLLRLGYALLVAGLMLALAVTGLALAQTPDGNEGVEEARPAWLVLDPAEPLDEVLPPLLSLLAGLKASGQIVDFEASPQRSAPDAVWAIPVALQADDPGLGGLPGVLAVVDQLPPGPGAQVSVQATTSITGQVTEEISPTTPISDALVRAYDGVTFLWLNSPGATTSAAGVYSTTVNPGSNQVKLRFSASGYAEEWYDDQISFNTAAVIAASGGTITSTNAQLARANAVLSGTVTLTPGGTLVDSALVRLYRASDGTIISTTMTSAGQFLFTGQAPGSYKVGFAYGGGTPIVSEFYQDKSSLALADSISLTSNTTSTLTAQVASAAVITGQVTDAVTTLPIANAQVTVFPATGSISVTSAIADASGIYTATGFGTGSYRLRFQATGMPNYQTEFYDDAATLAAATVVSATAGQTTAINEDLFPISATLTGLVTSTVDSGPLPNVSVELYRLDETSQQFALEDTTTTVASGAYTFSTVANGSYKVRVGFGDDDIIPHAFEWYLDAGLIDNATVISLTNSQSQSGVDVALDAGGCIAGQILNESEAPVSNAPFSVQDAKGEVVPVFSGAGGTTASFTTSPTSDSAGQGEFLACGLPTGTYTVDCGIGTVSGIAVTAGQATTDVVCGGKVLIYLPIIRKS